MKKVLHVGCGAATLKSMTAGFQSGWEEVRFDINPDVGPHIVGTITDMKAVADDSMDALYSSHNVEHVYAYQVASMLREFRRVLKPEGFAVITCPDIEIVAKFVAEGRLTEMLYMSAAGPISALDIIYGHGAAIAGGEEYMAHRTAFTAATLQGVLRHAGFGTIVARKRPSHLDLWAIATKEAVTEQRARELSAAYLPAKPPAI